MKEKREWDIDNKKMWKIVKSDRIQEIVSKNCIWEQKWKKDKE